jgi:GNAT superfamily N-acetyltransferase
MAGYAERARRGIARCADSDLSDLRAFQRSAYGLHSNDLVVFDLDWLFAKNPYRPAEGLGIWIARRDGRIVGQQAEIPFGLCVGGDELRASIAIALIVDPAWRLRGVGPALSETLRQSCRVVCALSISDDASRMYRRMGWLDLGEIPRYVLPLTAAAVRGTGARETVTRLAMTPATTFARLVARWRSASSQLVPVDHFDERADAIWNDARRSYPVLARRAAPDLRWRFDEGPHAHLYRRFYLLRRGEPIGYAVVRSKASEGRPTLKIVDYLSRPSSTKALLAHCILLAGRERHAMVELVTLNRTAHKKIRSLGFISTRRHDPLRFMLAVDPQDPLRDRIADPANWFVTSGDGDLEFVDRSTSSEGPPRSTGAESNANGSADEPAR